MPEVDTCASMLTLMLEGFRLSIANPHLSGQIALSMARATAKIEVLNG